MDTDGQKESVICNIDANPNTSQRGLRPQTDFRPVRMALLGPLASLSGSLAEALVRYYGIDPVPLYKRAGLDPASIGQEVVAE